MKPDHSLLCASCWELVPSFSKLFSVTADSSFTTRSPGISWHPKLDPALVPDPWEPCFLKGSLPEHTLSLPNLSHTNSLPGAHQTQGCTSSDWPAEVPCSSAPFSLCTSLVALHVSHSFGFFLGFLFLCGSSCEEPDQLLPACCCVISSCTVKISSRAKPLRITGTAGTN